MASRSVRRPAADKSLTVGYVRVSTDEQVTSGAGLEAQRSAIRAEAERRGWTVVAIFEDAGLSGKALDGREGLAKALAAVESGDAANLIVSKLDRLSRSLLDFAVLMKRAQEVGWNLVALDLGIDLSTPAGEFLASVMASAAQWERRIIGQRTKDALAEKRAAGVVLGRPARLPEEVCRMIEDARGQGKSLRVIAEELNEAQVPRAQGGSRWHASTVQAVLCRRSAAAS